MSIRTGLVWWFIFLVISALSVLVPPVQSPDENSHMARAYLVSQGRLFLETLPLELGDANSARPAGEATHVCCSQGGMVDRSLVRFFDTYLDLARDPQKRLVASDANELAALRWSGVELAYSLSGAGYYFPAIYLPQSLGLAIGRQAGATVSQSYYLSRALTLAICIGLLQLAFRIWRVKPLTLALLLLPMSLFQFASPTIDGLTYALTVVIMSGFCRLYADSAKDNRRLFWAWLCCIFLVVSSRTHMLPLILLPLHLAWHHKSRSRLAGGAALCVISLGWALFAMALTVDTRIVRDTSTGQLLRHYLSTPSEFIRIVWASLTDSTLFTFYQQTFVGVLGWLNVMLPAALYPMLWAGLGGCALVSISFSTVREDWPLRLMLLVLSVGSITLIFLAMLATWTPYPATLVNGVQGRYFLLPFVVMGYAAHGISDNQIPARSLGGWIVLALFAVLSIGALTSALLTGYH